MEKKLILISKAEMIAKREAQAKRRKGKRKVTGDMVTSQIGHRTPKGTRQKAHASRDNKDLNESWDIIRKFASGRKRVRNTVGLQVVKGIH